MSVEYTGGADVVKAVDDVSLNLGYDEFLGIVGESGSGKSTLGMSILRLLRPPGHIVGGRIIFEGRDLLLISEEELQGLRWSQLSLISQGAMSGLDPLYRIGDQIAEALTIHRCVPRGHERHRVRELLEAVRLEPAHVGSYPHELSGGMKQRVMIAMALACKPKLIIADEPTSALDVTNSSVVVELLKEIRRTSHLSMVVITHDLGIASELCDRLAVMHEGRIVEVAVTERLLTDPQNLYTASLISSIPTLDAVLPQE